MKKFVFCIIITQFLAGIPLFSQDASTNSGTASVLLLRLGPNPRISGLAEAFTGLVDDENAIYYNPAGLSNLKSGSIGLNHTEWFEDIRIDNLTFAYDISSKIGIGLGLTHLWMPSLESRDYLGQSLGTIDVSSSVLDLAFSYVIKSGFNVGVGIKYFQDKLANYDAKGFGFDLGLFLKTIVPGLSCGLVVQNFGGNVKYDRQEQKIPLTIRGGMAYHLTKTDLLFSLDAVKSNDTDIYLNLGSEYTFQNLLSLRVGNKFSKTEILQPSFSAGFHFKGQYNFYYTYSLFSDLGGTHRLGFTFNFKNTVKKSWKSYIPPRTVTLIPPKNVNVDLSDTELVIKWDRVTGVQYNVYAKLASQDVWKKLNSSPLYTNMIRYKKPAAPGKYQFRVTSVYNNQESIYSKEVFFNVE